MKNTDLALEVLKAARPRLSEKAAYAVGGVLIALLTLKSFASGVFAGVVIAGFWHWLELLARKRARTAVARVRESEAVGSGAC